MDTASSREHSTTSLMKYILHIVRSEVLGSTKPETRQDIANDFITIHYGVDENDVLSVMSQMVRAAGLLKDQVREFSGELQAARENMGIESASNVAPRNSFHDIESSSEDHSRLDPWPDAPALPDTPRSLPTGKAGYFPKIIEITRALTRLNSKMARTGEKPVGTTYVEQRKQRLHLTREKDPQIFRWTHRHKINQAQVPQNMSTARIQTTKFVVSEENPTITPATSPSHSLNASNGYQLKQAVIGTSDRRSYVEAEYSDSRGKRTRLARSAADNQAAAVTRQRKVSKDTARYAAEAQFKELETERNAQKETIDKMSEELHKQRKIAATQQEILEHLIKENKRHFELTSHESLNSTSKTLSASHDDCENEIVRLNVSSERLKNSSDAAKAVADQQAIDLEAVRQRLHVLEDHDLGAEDDVQRRATRLRDQINGGE
ncbi:predicted protein [Sclerotinia sclerotiorum 1980 UF-70]|uniref:Uncharacterized protein n=1 Tax=Sclerotinia sclerotiorum (strain ATCC 18683 / 1980 / Ss-1) TaxID=665079 RepID=A7EWW6_SCLS1|nr:predicted protein [Sclerotinia sclerotiorum 1980 UF-70]EDN93958.1 predicted protein [Sclerotinia sclerotiorum 1980 UF-70]